MTRRHALFSFLYVGSHIAATASIFGAIFSFAGLVSFLKHELSTTHFAIGISTAVAGALIGVFSVYLSRGFNLLRLKPRVFLSYSHEDSETAKKIAARLRSAGAMVWYDQDQLKFGDDIQKTIEKAIQGANSFVAVVSHEPGKTFSFEIGYAKANNVPIITILSGDTRIPDELKDSAYLKLNNNSAKSDAALDDVVEAALRSSSHRAP